MFRFNKVSAALSAAVVVFGAAAPAAFANVNPNANVNAADAFVTSVLVGTPSSATFAQRTGAAASESTGVEGFIVRVLDKSANESRIRATVASEASSNGSEDSALEDFIENVLQPAPTQPRRVAQESTPSRG